jgi:hypothetical protein
MTDERNNNISAEAFFKAKKEEFAKWALGAGVKQAT